VGRGNASRGPLVDITPWRDSANSKHGDRLAARSPSGKSRKMKKPPFPGKLAEKPSRSYRDEVRLRARERGFFPSRSQPSIPGVPPTRIGTGTVPPDWEVLCLRPEGVRSSTCPAWNRGSRFPGKGMAGSTPRREGRMCRSKKKNAGLHEPWGNWLDDHAGSLRECGLPQDTLTAPIGPFKGATVVRWTDFQTGPRKLRAGVERERPAGINSVKRRRLLGPGPPTQCGGLRNKTMSVWSGPPALLASTAGRPTPTPSPQIYHHGVAPVVFSTGLDTAAPAGGQGPPLVRQKRAAGFRKLSVVPRWAAPSARAQSGARFQNEHGRNLLPLLWNSTDAGAIVVFGCRATGWGANRAGITRGNPNKKTKHLRLRNPPGHRHPCGFVPVAGGRIEAVLAEGAAGRSLQSGPR